MRADGQDMPGRLHHVSAAAARCCEGALGRAHMRRGAPCSPCPEGSATKRAPPSPSAPTGLRAPCKAGALHCAALAAQASKGRRAALGLAGAGAAPRGGGGSVHDALAEGDEVFGVEGDLDGLMGLEEGLMGACTWR